ncbi:hypothetical protein L1267_11035 [Pseudoalteromonas sp. OFAV1]|jgi:hypothetical protein|uniref:hypothetical protein n=1 Tax=Pseudoalteromonas sp. OFAV1 TaxID=2908892 RepID=UPI001F4788EB|nr:hypothetical protein [Pseudoalteromonas sp. OFAV1]MCF2900938.1 hypothetical protein [Pseudoalteromonas sp. OFAV1]
MLNSRFFSVCLLFFTVLFSTNSFSSQSVEVASELYNYKTKQSENVNFEGLTKEQALNYLPSGKLIEELFDTHLLENENISLALLNTLIDIQKAKNKNDQVEMFSFIKMKKVYVDVSKLNEKSALEFLPQSDSIQDLFRFHLKQTKSVMKALNLTYKDAMSVLNEVNSK